LERRDRQPVYTVRLLVGDRLATLRIDATHGAVVAGASIPLPIALWTFDRTPPGRTPKGLSRLATPPAPQPGQWSVRADSAAPSPPNVLKLTTAAPDATFNVALFEESSYRDLDLRVAVRADAGKVDQGGGLVWRAKDENNYYICRINPLESNFRVYKVVNGKREQLQSAQDQRKTGQWQQLRVTMVGARITCYVDGTKKFEVTDETFPDAGLIGLWTKADASSSFDDLAVYATETGATAPR
jgi:hypothetical protein